MDTISKEHSKYLSRKPLEYYENKIMKQKKGGMWAKDYRINFPTGDENIFDDYFKIGNSSFRVCKYTVCKRAENNYICGLKFYYENINNPQEVIQGFSMGPQDMFQNKKYKFETFELKPNEYIIELLGNKGMIIDNFGVRTNLGRKFGYGGTGGGEYSLKAPEGFFFTCFGGLYSPGWDSISSFSTELKELPQNDSESQRREHSYHLKSYKPAFRVLIEFLSISEVTKLFRLNKDFANFRYDEYVLTNIGCRCIYSGIPRLIKYIKKVTKYTPESEVNSSTERIHNYLSLSDNFNTNPDGFEDFKGYQIVENGGNQIVVQKAEKESNYITSYGWCTLLWERKFDQLLSENKKLDSKEIFSKIQNAQYAMVFGAQFADTGFGGEGKLKLEIYDENNEILFQNVKPINDLTREYKYYAIKYIHVFPEKQPKTIKFFISGKDTCYWAGHYGAKIKTITMKILPIETKQEKILFETYVN